MAAFLLHVLRIIGFVIVFVFGTVTLMLVLQLEWGSILSGLITLIGIAVMRWTTQRLRRIREAKAELEPERYAVIVISDDEDETQKERVDEIMDQLFAMENISISYEYGIDALRSVSPTLAVDSLPYFLIVKDVPAEDLGEMLARIEVQSSDPAVLLQFLKEQIESHRRKLAMGRNME